MSPAVARSASSGDVFLGVPAAILPGDKVLGGALQTGDCAGSYPERPGDLIGVMQPHVNADRKVTPLGERSPAQK